MNEKQTQQFSRFYLKDIKIKLNKDKLNKNSFNKLNLSFPNNLFII